MGIMTWLRNQVRDAVLGGFADALGRLQEAEGPEVLLLESRPAEEEAPEPVRNGKRAKA